MFRRTQSAANGADTTHNQRAVFFDFLSGLSEEFDTLQRRHRFAALSDEAYNTLQMALAHTARQATRYSLAALKSAAINLECSISDVQHGNASNERRFELKRAFDEFTKVALRTILREDETRANARISGDGVVRPVILVIDTDHRTHKLMDRAIGRRCVVIGAYNGNAALETVKTTKPDLVVMNLDLPDIQGASLLQQLKSMQKTADIPIVVVSDTDDDGAVVCGMVGGAIDVIPKDAELPNIRVRLIESLNTGKVRLT